MRSFTQINIMAVFGVKYRLGLIDSQWQDQLYAVIGQTLKEIDGVQPVIIGGFKDHVHVLFNTRGNVAEEEIIRKIKTESSLWVNSRRLTLGRFGWQAGSGRISYSPSALPQVISYIANQAKHHQNISFRDEYENMLVKAGISYSKFDLPEELVDEK